MRLSSGVLGAPDVDGQEEEQPYDIDEVPVPGSSFEADMPRWRKVAFQGAEVADRQEDGANNDVEAMKARRHEKVRAIDVAIKAERSMAVFVGLRDSKQYAQKNRNQQAPFQAFAIVFLNCMVRPGRCTA